MTEETSEVVQAGFVILADGITASDYSLKNLNKALGEAQAQFGSATKDEENKWGGYKYTPLSSIVKAVRPALTKSHLTISQFPSTDLQRKTITMVTRLVHWDSGEWIQNTLEMPAELALGKDGSARFNQQTIGGSNTYAQKYAYKAILGIPDSEEMVDSGDTNVSTPDNTEIIKQYLDAIEKSVNLDELKKEYRAAYQWATKAKDKEAITLFTAAKEGRKKTLESPLNQQMARAVEKSAPFPVDTGDAYEGD